MKSYETSCTTHWGGEVKPQACFLYPDDIKALQEALSSEETSASVLVDKAVEKLCGLISENVRLRKVRSSFQDETCRAGKELNRLRDEVTELQSRCLTEEHISMLQDELGTRETEASKLMAVLVKDWADKEAAWDQLTDMYNKLVEKLYGKRNT